MKSVFPPSSVVIPLADNGIVEFETYGKDMRLGVIHAMFPSPPTSRNYNPPIGRTLCAHGEGAMGCSNCLHGQCTGHCRKDDKGKKKKRKKKHKGKKHKKQ